MPKKIALDYDDSELRVVVANCNGARVSVTHADVISLDGGISASEKLRAFIKEHQLEKTDTLVAIGRGKAELRELQLPPVPEEELPEMVRFQALRSFASAGEKAVVDFLPTGRTSEGNSMIAAAVSPQALSEINELCGTSGLIPKRVALRPLAAASLYLTNSKPPQICVLIDLLSADAEIVVAREGRVIFVRTVRLPDGESVRPRAIANEIRRTMLACGEQSTPDRIVVWGTPEVHSQDVSAIRENLGCEDVLAVDPFSLVDLQVSREAIPEHVGRLAPLVGLLVADEGCPERIVDFLNPRERPDEEPDHLRRAALIGVPLIVVCTLGYLVYKQFSDWDQKIAGVQAEVDMLSPIVKSAEASITRTEKVDRFLDSDVSWLDELKRLSEIGPDSKKMIVKNIYATADVREGGGDMRVVGTVSEPSIIEQFESSLRDEHHSVSGEGTQEQKDGDGYGWEMNERISISGDAVHSMRYSRMEALLVAEAEKADESEDASNGGDAGDSRSGETDPQEENSESSVQEKIETDEVSA